MKLDLEWSRVHFVRGRDALDGDVPRGAIFWIEQGFDSFNMLKHLLLAILSSDVQRVAEALYVTLLEDGIMVQEGSPAAAIDGKRATGVSCVVWSAMNK